jgi:acyl-CoA reductase-like NAD-dependent aldehyde dehydrogenase
LVRRGVGSRLRGNAGQVCVAPTRFLVQEKVYEPFLERVVAAAQARKVGPGLEAESTMGPLANDRRLQAMEDLVADAAQHGAKVESGGRRIGNKGYFFEPTVLTGVPVEAKAMNEEPFGPLALVSAFASFDEAITEANRLPVGLAAYAYTRSTKTATALASQVESGMLTINHNGLGLPEVPFGGIKDSGYGSEGGREAVEAYPQHQVRLSGRSLTFRIRRTAGLELIQPGGFMAGQFLNCEGPTRAREATQPLVEFRLAARALNRFDRAAGVLAERRSPNVDVSSGP